MIIEGRNSVLEALKAGKTFNKLLVAKNSNVENIVSLAREKGVRVDFVDKKVLDKTTTNNHQGVVGYITDFEYTPLDKLLSKENLFLVLLDGIEDPHNLGSIIRVCECAGVDGVIIERNRACAVTDTVVKVSAGAISHMPVARVTNLNSTIDDLKKRGVWCYACEAGDKSMYQVDLKGSIALVIGSEGKGVSRLTREKCDETISIPMFGKVNSLNASTAAAVAIYEAIRQRNN